MSLWAGIGLMAAGAVAKSLGAWQQVQAAAEVARFNAQIEQRNAKQQAMMIERQAELLDIERSREASALLFDLDVYDDLAERALASTRAAIGASGTEFTGSNLLVAAEQAEQLSLQRSVMVYQSEQRQADLEDEAAQQRFQAGETRRMGAFQARVGRRQAESLQRSLPLEVGLAGLGAAGASNQTLSARSLLRRRGTMRQRVPSSSTPMAFAPGE